MIKGKEQTILEIRKYTRHGYFASATDKDGIDVVFYADFDEKTDTIYCGTLVNVGILRDGAEIKYDFDESVEINFSKLYETLMSNHPELFLGE